MSTNTSEDRLADLPQREELALAPELAALRQRLGTELAVSRWRLVTVAPPVGGTIAHGYYTLSVAPTFESSRGGKLVCVAEAVYRVLEENR